MWQKFLELFAGIIQAWNNYQLKKAGKDEKTLEDKEKQEKDSALSSDIDKRDLPDSLLAPKDDTH